jgi:16S rRNA (uracil1498-N3)-methyltransferase
MPGSRKPTRLFVDAPLEAASLALNADQAHYLGRVLRCRAGDAVVVFNARGRERHARIESLSKHRPRIALGPSVVPLPEPATHVVLLQALVKSDAMDLVVQKATELGADSIFAARTEFGVVRLDAERSERKLAHWHRIAAGACEQSGRHRPPELRVFASLEEAIAALPVGYARIAFDADAGSPFSPGTGLPPGSGLSTGAAGPVSAGACLAIGPEGGFSPAEIELLEAEGFELHSLGPRILRTETAAIAALACVQWLVGDLGARDPSEIGGSPDTAGP